MIIAKELHGQIWISLVRPAKVAVDCKYTSNDERGIAMYAAVIPGMEDD